MKHQLNSSQWVRVQPARDFRSAGFLFGSLTLLAATFFLASRCWAQTDSRAYEIEHLRSEREKSLTPEMPSKEERKLLEVQHNPWLNRILERSSAGFKLAFGGMDPAAGFAIGPDWKRSDLWGERLQLGATARVSINHSYMGAVSATLPELFDGKGFVGFSAVHRDLSQVPFYGTGPDSRKTGRSAYRLEDSTLELRPGVRPVRHLQLGVIGGWYSANVGPGDTSTYISADQQFSPAVAPGIDRQGNFLKSGVFAAYDRRGVGTEPVSGYRYTAEWARLSDQSFGTYSHGRLDLDAQQYVSFFNERRVIALHGHTTLTDIRQDQAVPFYMQPNLGGPDTLRGFRPYRFTGPNAMWMNAEYRWEAGAALDVVLFADGGKVFDRWERLNVHDLEGSAGFGFRFKVRHDLAFRLDTGFSHEGVQLWLRFNNAF